MEPTEDNITWAVGRLAVFQGRLGFPENGAALRAHAEAFLKLVHNRVLHHPKVGDVNDAEYTLRTAFENMQRFPQPVEFRQIYTRYWPPASPFESIEEP